MGCGNLDSIMTHTEASPASLRILSFNCWGLKYLAKHRNARLTEIGRRIATSEPLPEIVGLQECWTQEDYLSIREQTRHVLPHGKYYYSGIFGGGLAILSKWPIEQSSMVRYPLNGRPTAFFRGDWYVGKGVACARIRIGPRPEDVVEVFCTHLHAPYEREPNDSYICHRTAQAWEIAKLLRGAAERGHLVIALGDFNMVPLSLAHRLITAHAPVQDVWRVLHPDSSVGAAEDVQVKARGHLTPTAEYNLTENGTTCDSVLNTWRWSKEQRRKLGRADEILVNGQTQDVRAKRLDYIFFGQCGESGAQTGDPESTPYWIVDGVNVGMTDRHPTLKCSLSDHFSVEATLKRYSEDVQEANGHMPAVRGGMDTNYGADVDTEKLRQTSDRVLRAASGHVTPLPPATYDEILEMIAKYKKREYRQRSLRLSHFVLSTVASLGCLVAVWWSPRNFVSFILMLLSTFGLGFGIIDGMIGGLFVNAELRTLEEFEWEIRNARDHADSRTGVSGEPQ